MDGGYPVEDREPRRARSRSPAREREIRESDSAPPPREDRDSRADRGSYSRDDRPPAPSSYRGPRNQPPAEKNNVIGVFGLSLQTQERDLEEEFGQSGRVEKVTIVYDQRSQRSRGFGFIIMQDVEGATRAIAAMNGQELHGRRIRVDYSTTSRPHNPTPGQYMGLLPPSRDGPPPPSRYDDRPPRRDYDDRRRGDPYGDSRGSRYDRDRDHDDRRRRDDSPPRRRRSPSPRGGRSPPPREYREERY